MGGGNIQIEFPIELSFDYCIDTKPKTCYRNADELSINLYNYLYEVCNNYGTEDEAGFKVLYQFALIQKGIEMYMIIRYDDVISVRSTLTGLSVNFDNTLVLSFEDQSAILKEDGSLTMEI